MEIQIRYLTRSAKITIKFLFLLLVLFLICPNSQVKAQNNPPGDKDALIQELNLYFQEPPRLIESKIVRNYAFGTIMTSINGELQEGEGLSFLAIWENNKWSMYYEGSKEFIDLIKDFPDELVSHEIKRFIIEEYKNVNWEDDYEPLLVTGYRLPWTCGTSMYIRQDWDSHAAGAALDIDMNLNTIITAAASGTVYAIKENETACGCSDSIRDLGNYITIHNNQGYYDTYYHIAQWGAFPVVGDPVYQGQEIAYSYKTGKTCGSRAICDSGTCNVADCNVYNHLHFEVEATYNGTRLRPVFDDVGEVQIGWYTSGNCPDTTPPVSSISLSGTLGENNWYISNVIATISASDNFSGVSYSQYSLNGAGWVTYSGPFTVPLNGLNTIQYRSVDVYGNWEAAKSISFNIDTVVPTNPTSITSGCSAQSDIWQNFCNSPNFFWSGASDATSGLALYKYYWGTDPLGSTGTETPFSLYVPPPVTDGFYYLRIRTKDNAGNWSDWLTLFILRYDVTAPIGSILIMNGWETTSQVLVNIDMEVSDTGSGSVQYHVRNSGESWSDWSAFQGTRLWLLPAVTGHDYSVEVEYKDAAENFSQVVVDSTYLDIYPDHPASQNYQLIKDTFGIGATDAQSINYLLNGTLAQESASGYSESSNYKVISGFWDWIREILLYLKHYLPMITK